jgi:hypothetical protein
MKNFSFKRKVFWNALITAAVITALAVFPVSCDKDGDEETELSSGTIEFSATGNGRTV